MSKQGLKGVYWFHLFGSIEKVAAVDPAGDDDPVEAHKTVTHVVSNIVHPDDYVATIAGKAVQGLPYVESFDHDPSEDEIEAALKDGPQDHLSDESPSAPDRSVVIDEDVIEAEVVEELS